MASSFGFHAHELTLQRFAMSTNYTDEQLRLAARLYYVDGLGQTAVARFVKVSQTKVSRLLALAKERGIVRISVAEYEPRDATLEKKLRSAFHIKSVAVVKTVEKAGVEDARRATGHFGADFVRALIPARSTVAIAGGRTMRELVATLPEAEIKGLTVLQGMGSIDSTVTAVDALELGREMARRWSGRFCMINTPAFVPDAKTRDAFLAIDQIKAVWQRFKSVDVALVGVGTLANSVFVERGILNERDVEGLRKAGAVGEIFGRFFDRRGRECTTEWQRRIISMSIDQLRKVPQVVAIVTGADRAEALASAIRGGLIKALVIDDRGAASLLSHS
ncbi:MAG TPA: sugar-binding domain-containing protein [Pirellulales bacterium]|nr:sugar-binding domain-containing protein [Pirellulales bacterium]